MAEFLSGNGGYITIDGTRLDIGKWTLDRTMRLVENTHSGVGATNFNSVVPHYEWQLEVPYDLENPPEDLAEEGDEVTIVFNVGNPLISGTTRTLTNTRVEKLGEVDDQSQDIFRTAMTGKGGSLS